MLFNKHSNLAGQHAFLSASSYHWVNYDLEKLAQVYVNAQAARRGTELHAFAHEAVRLGVRLRGTTQTLTTYVNDAIGYRMTPEQVLFYSGNCFGTADTISFSQDRLRVHDLKTGTIPGSMQQPRVYAALFCLEYNYRPGDIAMELRIYQNDEVVVEVPDVDVIARIMSKIITFDKEIEKLKLGG